MVLVTRPKGLIKFPDNLKHFIVSYFRNNKIIVTSLKKLSNSERLKRLKLPTLTYLRRKGDMIEVYTIVSGKYDNNIARFKTYRVNLFKLKK